MPPPRARGGAAPLRGQPEFNILKTAGSSLGFKHSEVTRAKRSGENNHFYGKAHTPEALAKISKAKTDPNYPMHGFTGDKSPTSKKYLFILILL